MFVEFLKEFLGVFAKGLIGLFVSTDSGYGGILGGFWGIVISLPITIIILTTYKFFEEDINRKVGTMNRKKTASNGE